MKKLLTLLAIPALLVLSSCGKDDDDSIVGAWTITDVEVVTSCTPDSPAAKQAVKDLVYEDAGMFSIGITMTFLDDGTFTVSLGSLSVNGTYSYANNVLTTMVDGEGGNTQAKISGKTLRLSPPEDEMIDDSDIEEIEEEFGVTINSVKVAVVLTRQ